MNWIVFFAAVGLTIAIWVAVPAAQRALHAGWDFFEQVAGKRAWVEWIVFFIALIVAALPTLIWSTPSPVESDEYAYLLAADTFAHGRLTNPPHPMAQMLETAEVIQSPTYSAKYPPAQGLFLAIGLKLHVPIFGAWLSGAMACAAITWMLRAFVPRDEARWALFGGLLAATHPLIEWWNNCYWGGNVAMLGAAMLLGGVIRLLASPKSEIRHPKSGIAIGIVIGIGLSLLALSRPFEGAIVAAIVLLPLAFSRPFKAQVILWIALALLPALAFLAYFNFRVTGNALLFPHLLHARQYLIVPRFFWESPRTSIVFHSRIMHDFAMIEMREYQHTLGVKNFARHFAQSAWKLIEEYDFPLTLLLASIAGFVAMKKNRALQIAAAVVVLFPVLHLAMIPITRVVYFAPAFPALFALIVCGARWIGQRVGAAAIVAVMLIAQAAVLIARLPALNALSHPAIALARADDLAKLRALPGKQLVLVRDAPRSVPISDFVKNDADIDGEKVVCARSIDPAHDQELLNYFHDRTAWLLTADQHGYEMHKLEQWQ